MRDDNRISLQIKIKIYYINCVTKDQQSRLKWTRSRRILKSKMLTIGGEKELGE